jgi:hypothetical protein
MARSRGQVRGWRASGILERCGTSPEGATGPRARRASPEGASSPRARQNLTRGVTDPRARRSFVSAVLRPSSEAEFRPRVPGPTVLVDRWGHQGRDYVVHILGLRICLCLCFLRKKMGFPLFFWGPLWLSPTGLNGLHDHHGWLLSSI